MTYIFAYTVEQKEALMKLKSPTQLNTMKELRTQCRCMRVCVCVCVDNGFITLTSSIIIVDDFTSTTEPYTTASLKRGRIHFCCEIDSLTPFRFFSPFPKSLCHCMPHCLFTIQWANVRQTTAQIYTHVWIHTVWTTTIDQKPTKKKENGKMPEREKRWHPHRFS